MAITAMGLGNKAAPEGANLDPQREFWSWLAPFVNPDDKGADGAHHERGYFSGFACTQTDPAGMSIKIGGGSIADSALLVLTDGRCVLLSTNGEPEVVTIPTAPASGSRIDAVVSYIDTTSPTPDTETPGTPEYVHTIVVSGTASSNPSAPTDSQIVNALPAGANSKYYRWCDVKVAANQTVITNSDITDKKPMSPNLYDSLTFKGFQGSSSVWFTQDGVTITTISLPAGRVRFGMFFCNVGLSTQNIIYPRVLLEGIGAQASFQLSAATGQASICIPFSTTDTSLTSIRVRGWNTTEAHTFERMSWWCVGIK